MSVCYIVGAGECPSLPIHPADGDWIIAADGGYCAVQKAGLHADWVVGDFDSLGDAPAGERILRHPVEKDDTDTMLAVKIGLAHGFRRFRLYGGLGGRLDHTIANLHALAYLDAHGAEGRLIGAHETAAMLSDGTVRFSAAAAGTLSVFAWGGRAAGVTLTGLHYPLCDAVLTPEFPLGVSNEFTGAESEVTVRSGRLLLIWCGEPDWMRL